jgi:hypothetical protein
MSAGESPGYKWKSRRAANPTTKANGFSAEQIPHEQSRRNLDQEEA